MKPTLALATFAAAALAGCAAAPDQVADAGCKVQPVTAANTVNKKREPSEIDRKWAAADLRSSGYYRQAEQRDPLNATTAQAARDCP